MAGKVNIPEKLDSFSDHWAPRIVARFNENDIMVVRVEGEFVWHKHDDTDDFFLVLDGELTSNCETVRSRSVLGNCSLCRWVWSIGRLLAGAR
jgi:mannose-6-phosphate isomerase-like protein (cupin superfamily)